MQMERTRWTREAQSPGQPQLTELPQWPTAGNSSLSSSEQVFSPGVLFQCQDIGLTKLGSCSYLWISHLDPQMRQQDGG